MKFERILLLTVLLGCWLSAAAQDADLPLQHEAYHYIDRLDIKGLTGNTVHTDLKPYGRGSIAAIFAEADTSSMNEKELKWFRLSRIAADDDYANEQEGATCTKTNAIFSTTRREKCAFMQILSPTLRAEETSTITQRASLRPI
jgi:hypothetical protein